MSNLKPLNRIEFEIFKTDHTLFTGKIVVYGMVSDDHWDAMDTTSGLYIRGHHRFSTIFYTHGRRGSACIDFGLDDGAHTYVESEIYYKFKGESREEKLEYFSKAITRIFESNGFTRIHRNKDGRFYFHFKRM